ncbi:hypothetical protein VPH35_099924 [Triticum aestivum]
MVNLQLQATSTAARDALHEPLQSLILGSPPSVAHVLRWPSPWRRSTSPSASRTACWVSSPGPPSHRNPSLSILSLERSEEEERRETQDTMVPAHERLPHERRLPRVRTRAPHKQQYVGWSFIHGRAHTTPRSPLLHARTLRTP